MIIEFKNQKFEVKFSNYLCNKRLSISLYDIKFNDLYCVVTTNIPKAYLEYNEVIIDRDYNTSLISILNKYNIIDLPHRQHTIEYQNYKVNYNICHVLDTIVLLNHLSNNRFDRLEGLEIFK